MANVKKKTATKKRRDRKVVEKGAVHIRSSFNNTMVTVTDSQGNAPLLGLLRRAGLPRFPEVHPPMPPRWPPRPPRRPPWSTA